MSISFNANDLGWETTTEEISTGSTRNVRTSRTDRGIFSSAAAHHLMRPHLRGTPQDQARFSACILVPFHRHRSSIELERTRNCLRLRLVSFRMLCCSPQTQNQVSLHFELVFRYLRAEHSCEREATSASPHAQHNKRSWYSAVRECFATPGRMHSTPTCGSC